MIRYVTLFFLLFIASIHVGIAQNGSIRGFVYTQDDGEPSIYTNVYLKGTTLGNATDLNGFFSITKVPPGNYLLLIHYLGYDSIKDSITVKANEIITKKYFLKKGGILLKEFVLSARKKERQEKTDPSKTTLDPEQINSLPPIGGMPDVAQLIQIVPGVVFTGDQGGQLYIRGGTPIQNKLLLDGMIVYNPFHSIGLFSVIDADIIRNADIYTGGYNAQYGGRISSIMDFTTRDGNKKKTSVKLLGSTFGSKLLVEGPIIRAKEDADKATISYIFSAKNSYLPYTSKLLYSYIDTAGLPFSFQDYYGKVSINSGNGSKWNLFGFNFNDQVTNYKRLANFGWKSTGVGTNFIALPANSDILVKGNFAYSNYKMTKHEVLVDTSTSSIDGFNMGLNFVNYIGKQTIEYGLEVLGFSTDFVFFNEIGTKVKQEEFTTEIASFAKATFITKNKKLIFEPGLRFHYYSSLRNFSPEPRFNMKWNIADKFRFKSAMGLYSQNLISATSDRDVVNLFYGFLSGPDNLQKTFTDENGNTKEITHKLQKAYHLIAGFEWDPYEFIEVNIETYFKNFTQLSNINRTKIFEDNGDNFAQPDNLKKDFIIETGKAYGGDILVKTTYKNFYFWTVYSLNFVSRWDGTQTYPPHFDRRHNVNLVTSYKFGKHKSWEVDARWNYGSGFPFTPTQGFFENITINNINANYTSNNGTMEILYGKLNSRRLPSFHRLDLSVKKKFFITDMFHIEATAGVTNAYNRNNIFYFDRVQYKRVDQLPFLPTVSVSMSF